MGKQTTGKPESSSEVWDYLEEMLRVKVREFIQGLLEDEITELLGRGKSERREGLDASQAYRNGYGKRRRLTLGCGTITVRRPRVRGLAERFKSRVLPLFARRTKEVNQLLPQLYLHGLAQGDFDLALRGLMGEEAPISASTIARLKESWQAEWEEWRRRSLKGLRLVYMWVDGVYIKAGLEKTKAALLVRSAMGCSLIVRDSFLAVCSRFCIAWHSPCSVIERYTSVVFRFSCPRSAWTTLILLPDSNKSVANLCLKV